MLHAQCGNIDFPPSQAVTEDYSSEEFNINLYFVLIRKNDGSGDIQDSILPGIMSELEETYGPYNISFTQGCTRYIDSTTWYEDGAILAGQLNDIGDSLGSSHGITVFIQKNGTTDVLGQAGQPVPQPFCWFKYIGANKIASHEIGHTLNLFHTDFEGFGMPCYSVTAHDTTRGDLVADTPIDYHYSEPVVNCLWDTALARSYNYKDNCGELLHGVDPTIIMCNLADYECVDHFTPGQANRMKSSIMNNTGGTHFNVEYIDLEVSGKLTIDSPTHVGKNIIIGNYDTLEILSTLYMPSKGRIIVEPGGVLQLTGGKITKGSINDICNERTGNPIFWYGIEMQNSNSGIYPRFYCQNGTIEFSEMGIHNPPARSAGNVHISIDSATFRNNKNSLQMIRGAGFYLPIVINRSRFYLDSEYPLSHYETQIKVDNSRLTMDSCTFDNPSKKPVLDVNNYCIQVFNTNLGIDHSVFKDSLYGIQSMSLLSKSTLSVTRSKFNRMFVGVNTTAGINNYSITKDTFDTSWKTGLLSNHCTGFKIHSNEFINSGFYSNSLGIQMEESGNAINNIQNNHFSYLKYGNLAIGVNGGIGSGLQYKCNSNDVNNIKDFKIEGSIADIQGVSNNAAGNTSDGYVSFDLQDLTLNRIVYYHLDSNGHRPTSVPGFRLQGIRSDSLSCTIVGKINPETLTHLEVWKERSDTLMVRKETYSAFIDGGNSAALVAYINSANSGNAAYLHNHLLNNVSPWLSYAAAFAAYDRSDLYDSTQRANLLFANPDLFRSGEFRYQLTNADTPLAESSLQAIDSLTHYETDRTQLEAEMSFLGQEMSALCYDKLHDLKMDTVEQNDSIITWLDRANDYRSKREIMELYLRNENFTEAASALAELNELPNLAGGDVSDLQALDSLLPYMVIILEDERYEGSLSEEEKEWMIEFAEENINLAGNEVRSVLLFYYDIEVDDLELLNGVKQQANAINGTKKEFQKQQTSNAEITIFPNPANDEITILFPEDSKNGRNINLYDLNGKSVWAGTSHSRELLLDTENLPTGIYLMYIIGDSNIREMKRIQIIK